MEYGDDGDPIRDEYMERDKQVFFRTKAEMDAYHDMSRKPEDWPAAEIE